MVVYIFPIDSEKAQRGEIRAGKCEERIRGLPLTVMNINPLYREEARKVHTRLSEASPEIPVKDSIIVVDPDLGFSADEIADDFSFGNGTTIGGVRLKSGAWVPCGFVVFDHAEKAAADGLLVALRNIFKGK